MEKDTVTIIGRSPKTGRPKHTQVDAFIFEEESSPVFALTTSMRDLEKSCSYLEIGALIAWKEKLYRCSSIDFYPYPRFPVIQSEFITAGASPEINMLFPEHVTLLMKTTLQGKPAIKTIDTEAKITTIGEEVQFDLNLTNRDLLHRSFVVDDTTRIRHDSGTYQCTGPAFKIGRPII